MIGGLFKITHENYYRIYRSWRLHPISQERDGFQQKQFPLIDKDELFHYDSPLSNCLASWYQSTLLRQYPFKVLTSVMFYRPFFKLLINEKQYCSIYCHFHSVSWPCPIWSWYYKQLKSVHCDIMQICSGRLN